MKESDQRERSPFWCTTLIFSRAYGHYFMSHVIVRQSENYTQDLHYNIPKYWVIQNTPYGYIDRGAWVKEIVHFNNFCGLNQLNTQVLFYDDHDGHFGDRDIHILRSHHIKPFVLKVVDSVNDQPNDNGPNLKLKGLYGQARMK